jgi:hypothetical protein
MDGDHLQSMITDAYAVVAVPSPSCSSLYDRSSDAATRHSRCSFRYNRNIVHGESRALGAVKKMLDWRDGQFLNILSLLAAWPDTSQSLSGLF